MIGVDRGAFWGQMQGGVDVWRDVGNGVVKSFVFGVDGDLHRPAAGLRGAAHARRRVARDHAHGGGRFAAVLGLDFILTALMFSI